MVWVVFDYLLVGQECFYCVWFEDLDDCCVESEKVVGWLVMVLMDCCDVIFFWFGDMVGQGFGIDESQGGMVMYVVMCDEVFDFFIYFGDFIYVDNLIVVEVMLCDGQVWCNVVIEVKLKVVEIFVEFCGNYVYNMFDVNVCLFNVVVFQIVQWDDYEMINNWYLGEVFDDLCYMEKQVLFLVV